MIYFIRLILGLSISSIISYIAYKKQALSLSGVIGAVIIGTGIFFSSSFYGSVLVIVFFSSCTLFGFLKDILKTKIEKQYKKSSGRDFFQVFANGGVGLIYSLLYFFTLEPIYIILIGVSYAAPNADTWASELGVLGYSEPIHLRTLKRVPKGTSGAISLFGSILSFLGALLISIFAILLIIIFHLKITPYSLLEVFILILLGGSLGSFIDSILGAFIQGIYFNEELKKEIEQSTYNEKTNKLIRGYRFFNNDLVNFTSVLLSSIVISRFL